MNKHPRREYGSMADAMEDIGHRYAPVEVGENRKDRRAKSKAKRAYNRRVLGRGDKR